MANGVSGGNDGTGRPISAEPLGTDDLNLEDMLADQDNNSLGELDRYDYPNAGRRMIIGHDD